MKPIRADEVRMRAWVEFLGGGDLLRPETFGHDIATLLAVIDDLRSEIRGIEKSVADLADRARAAAEREMMATREIWAAIRKAVDEPMGTEDEAIRGGPRDEFNAYLRGRREAVDLIEDLAEAELRRGASRGWFDVADLFTAIAHGDDAHRAWLLAALRAYRDGAPIPPPASRAPGLLGPIEADAAALIAQLEVPQEGHRLAQILEEHWLTMIKPALMAWAIPPAPAAELAPVAAEVETIYDSPGDELS